MYILEASCISKKYQESGKQATEVLRNVNLQIEQGEMVAVMGPSGSGKTTLLHVLTGVDTPDCGEIKIGGEEITQLEKEEVSLFRRKHMGMIFQDFQLLESLTVKENILLPLILDGRDEEEQTEAVEKVLGALGISELAEKGILELSGGEKQRTAIARALIHEPEMIFGDELTGSLDRKTTGDVMRCMRQMNRAFSISFLLVTHDAYAAAFCDRVLLLQNGTLTDEVKRQGSRDVFRADIVKMLCQPGGESDDLF